MKKQLFLLMAFKMLFPLTHSLASKPKSDELVIPYGSDSRIIYHLSKGTYDLQTGSRVFVTAAYSRAKNGAQMLSSTAYTSVKHQELKWKDQQGSGKKYTITLSAAGLPQMEQIFYVYPGHDYFFTAVQLNGTKLSSNYMAPLVADQASIYSGGDVRNLFVPFDNDTFIRYNAKSTANEVLDNTSSEVGALYDNTSRKGLIVASLEHMVWKTGIRMKGRADQLSQLTAWGGYTDEQVTRDKRVHGSVTGNLIKSPLIFIGYFADWRSGLEAYGKANRMIEKPYVFNWSKPVPFGWNSWGVIQEKINYEKALKVVDFFADRLPAFRNGNTAYIDLDSFWDNFTGGMRGDYTKLKAFADYCKSKGLEPGAYWAPFTDWGYQGGGNGEAEGSKYKFKDMWTKVNGGYHDFDGARALDPTHPGTRKRIDYIIGKLKSCGFKMIKIDFLGHATVEADAFYDPSVSTGMQAYRSGMEYLTDQLDGQMLVYAAISPNLATGRYAHVRRIACDAWKTIKDTEYTLNSVNYGWWQKYVYNYIDADHVVFSNESEGVNRARLTSSVITGTLITGDDFSSSGVWMERAEKLLQNKDILNIAKSGLAFMPVDGNTGDHSNELFVRKIDDYLYLAVLNYSSAAKSYHIPLERLGLKKAAYIATALFENKEIKLEKEVAVNLAAADAKIIKIKLR
ncbi:alpha-galactosidase [Pedobacter sp. GR22-6]|uniref:alpha-galactosidase n=1 Tax=Pedobacter sp. GR22-6 TaxID=3127957 RepID=UPI00307E7418